VLDGAGGERLLSIGRLEADMLIMTAIGWYRGQVRAVVFERPLVCLVD
jgi:hypothetical protein